MALTVGVPREVFPGEKRVATVPEVVEKLIKLGFRVADRCMQIHGGIGLAAEMPIAKMWRDARSFMITEGPVEVMRMVLAREIFRGKN